MTIGANRYFFARSFKNFHFYDFNTYLNLDASQSGKRQYRINFKSIDFSLNFRYESTLAQLAKVKFVSRVKNHLFGSGFKGGVDGVSKRGGQEGGGARGGVNYPFVSVVIVV